MNNEVWKNVIGYEGLYEVSNFGRVRTHINKITYTEHHGIRKWKQRLLKQKVDKDRSCRVSLWKDGKEKTWLVHRLVAIAFLENPEDKLTVNHIDGNRLNNHIMNLEWSSHTENNNHAFDNNLINTGNSVELTNKTTKDVTIHRSMSKASLYMNRNIGYISNKLKKSQHEDNDYSWRILK